MDNSGNVSGLADKVGFDFIRGERANIKSWTKGISVADNALAQIHNIAKLPFIHRHVAVMPDVHWGMGATIGSVIPTKGAIVPAAVGVDLGCGMMAQKTSLRAEHLPDNLRDCRDAIERAVPHGRTNNGKKGDRGSWGDENAAPSFDSSLVDRYNEIIEKHPKAKGFNCFNHMGTLGTGNHFIEICLDENDNVWIMLHSGSRGPGNRIGMYFIDKAKEEMERWHIAEYLPDRDLSYFVEHTDLFDDYVQAVGWAQDFALENRKAMMRAAIKAAKKTLGDFELGETAVNCHHNYVERENHFGENVWLTRKGAVRARVGDLGIIPGSMGAKSFIVEGKGNRDSFCSCSHGAGRMMSRGEARRKITVDDHAKATMGIECRKDADVIDESPSAYKNIDEVMAAQRDLVSIRHTLRQIVNVKG